MDEQEAREWLRQRQGARDFGSDLADLEAPSVLAKAAYERRKKWVNGLLFFTAIGLLALAVVLWAEGSSGIAALIGVMSSVAFFIAIRTQWYFDRRDSDFE